MWTGFYAGLNAGYNFGTENVISVTRFGANRTASSANFLNNNAIGDVILGPAIGTASGTQYRQRGFIGGGQVGYNYQYSNSFVLGVEADIQGMGSRGSAQISGFGSGAKAVGPQVNGMQPGALSSAVGGIELRQGVDWLGTVRGRFGYLWSPTLLVFGTGGFAYGGAYANVASTGVTNISTSTNINGGSAAQVTPLQTNASFGGGNQNQILTGWTAGGGAEWMFMPNWSLKAEALYWNLGNMNVQSTIIDISGRPDRLNNAVSVEQIKVNYQGVIARAGVNYHFNWGAAPIVAAY